MGVIYEKSIWAFLFITILAGGGAAFMIGRAAAKGWNPFWQAMVQVLGAGSRGSLSALGPVCWCNL